MAMRCLLHKSKLQEFGCWMLQRGYSRVPTKGYYEVMRLHKLGSTVVIYEKADSTEHYSVQDKDVPLVRLFIRESKVRK